MSTILTASSRGRGGSMPNRRGGSPLWTQRQNFFSAVSSRCWYSGSAWMVISTHLPPPVMIDSTADRGVGDPHIVLQLRHVLFGRGFFREGPGQHELGFEHRAGGLDEAIQRRRHPFVDGMLDPLLNVLDGVTGVALVPAPVEVFGHGAELDDQVVGEVFRLDLAALLPPQPDQSGLIVAHDDPGIRAADEGAAIHWIEPDRTIGGGEGRNELSCAVTLHITGHRDLLEGWRDAIRRTASTPPKQPARRG